MITLYMLYTKRVESHSDNLCVFIIYIFFIMCKVKSLFQLEWMFVNVSVLFLKGKMFMLLGKRGMKSLQ